MTPARAAQARNTSIAAGNESPIPLTRKEKIKPLLSLSKNYGEISRRKVPEPKAFAVYLGHFFRQLLISARRRIVYE